MYLWPFASVTRKGSKMNPFYSVEAMISSNGKNYKGTLDFFDDKCILHNATRVFEEFHYELDTAELETGITSVLFLGLYTKEKPYIRIRYQTKESPMFILDEDKIEASISALQSQKTQNFPIQQGADQKPTANAQNERRELSKPVTGFNEMAIGKFLHNPYAILGIASSSSMNDANEALSKIKKLDRLKAIGSYKTNFKLAGFDPIARDLPMCQNALASLKELKYKWVWFDTVEGCKNWQFEWYREPFVSSDPGTWSYDVFLAQYLSLLIFDVNMKRRQDWYDIFAFYQYVVDGAHAEFLRAKLNTEEDARFSDAELIESFSQNIFEPLNSIIESAGIESMLSFFRSLRMDRFSAMKDYKRNLGGTIAQWFINQEKIVWEKIESYIGTGELSAESTEVVRETARVYDDNVQSVYDNALAALTKELLCAKMVKTSYAKAMRQMMILLLAGNCKAEACKYANRYYKFADKDFKLKIIATFGVEAIDGASDDLPELMKTVTKPKADKPMVSNTDFEDITICDDSFTLPRVDFCGLDFDHHALGIKFWLMNRTSTDLKFWLMDIHVNGVYCGSTEIIATVEKGDNDFYTYELDIPSEVGYYSVEQIEFYVEIDKPGNQTIHDTSVVKIKCDTISEVLSAEYESE